MSGNIMHSMSIVKTYGMINVQNNAHRAHGIGSEWISHFMCAQHTLEQRARSTRRQFLRAKVHGWRRLNPFANLLQAKSNSVSNNYEFSSRCVYWRWCICIGPANSFHSRHISSWIELKYVRQSMRGFVFEQCILCASVEWVSFAKFNFPILYLGSVESFNPVHSKHGRTTDFPFGVWVFTHAPIPLFSSSIRYIIFYGGDQVDERLQFLNEKWNEWEPDHYIGGQYIHVPADKEFDDLLL